jgi:hypothetical protein
VEQQLLREPVRLRWELTKSPAGAHQWKAKNGAGPDVPERARSVEAPAPMLTTDLSLRFDPATRRSPALLREPDQFATLRPGWFKLTHRDMGPVRATSALGQGSAVWQDRSRGRPPLIASGTLPLKAKILASVSFRSWSRRWGLGGHVPRLRQAGRRQRRRIPPGAAEGLGRQPAGQAREGAADTRGDPEGVQRLAVRRKKVSHRPK